jgi:DNA-binding response OmpR family regulator
VTWCEQCRQGIFNKAGVFVDTERGYLEVRLKSAHLTPQEAVAVEAIADCHPRPATYDFIAERLYPNDADEPSDPNRSIRVLVHKCRHVLAPFGHVRIDTVPPVGYGLRIDQQCQI